MTGRHSAQVVQAADHDGVLVMCVTGELDVATMNEVGSALFELLAKEPRGLVLELAVQFLGSSGLSMLLELWGRTQRDGVGFALVTTHNGARHALMSSSLSEVLPLAGSVDEAVTQLRLAASPERGQSDGASCSRGVRKRQDRN